ncbi:hypothetical protein DENSPDRAFT_98115 [Dentipellis sp. KUC8613]|nr:hypothetical protein DENSPDRAFT_98115 [Dentipellis sp. KUC8613]
MTHVALVVEAQRRGDRSRTAYRKFVTPDDFLIVPSSISKNAKVQRRSRESFFDCRHAYSVQTISSGVDPRLNPWHAGDNIIWDNLLPFRGILQPAAVSCRLAGSQPTAH